MKLPRIVGVSTQTEIYVDTDAGSGKTSWQRKWNGIKDAAYPSIPYQMSGSGNLWIELWGDEGVQSARGVVDAFPLIVALCEPIFYSYVVWIRVFWGAS